ncbi:LysM peptidoglycan-binding domain-containing protein [Scopulibacillus cellulosilyticus]|uniref:LysM peptidoglycan-binding domain-containing protein n=1 Tax=Scopulibacillus cellulosilyticus TaxID=2665665 RepID=A0ABW2PTH4_9BACL
MQVHVVSAGETISTISNKYHVSAQQILNLNQITNPNQLIAGRTLLIPVQPTYTVKPGDTLWSIAKKYNVDYQQLLNQNPQLEGQILYPGTVIKLPERKKPTIIVNGFLEPSPSAEHFEEAKSALTYLSIFQYKVTADGNIVPPKNEEVLLNAVKNSTAAPLMTITNIDSDEFSEDIAKKILSSTSVQNHLFENLVNQLKEKGFRGVNVDFEFLGTNARQPYNRFLKRLTDRLHKEKFKVATSLAPKLSGQQTGAWYEAHDYETSGKIVDFVILMTYEWGWSGGPPMAVSPISQVRAVVNYARSVIPKDKIVMSIPLYGYDWTLPYVEGGEFAKAVTTNQAYQIAAQYHAQIQYDVKSEAPFFYYNDENGKRHVVWFGDLRMMEAMFQMVNEYQLGGISFWNLAFRYPQVWPLITEYFNVKKVKQ